MWNFLLLLSSFALASVNAQEQIVRFDFKFGFFADDQTPLTEVIKDDVEGVLCQTQYFLSQLVQNATGTKSVHAEATDINWGYFEGEELPAQINFTVEFTDAVLGDVNWLDDQILIDEMEAMGEEGLQNFITQWVWKAEPQGSNFFLNANKMSFDGIKRGRIEGEMATAECPATAAPTMAPTVSAAPTTAETAPEDAAQGGDAPVEADGDDPNGSDGDAAGSPEILGGNGGSPIGNPSDGGRKDWPFGVNYGDLTDLEPMPDFMLAFHMFEDHEKPPTEDEINALMCKVNNFFTQELRRKMADDTIHSKAVFIDWYFDEGGAGDKEDIIVNFTSFNYFAGDEHTQIPSVDVFEAMKLSTKEIDILVEEFVWKSEPENNNMFSHTKKLSISGDAGQPLNDQSMMIEADGCILPPTGEDSGGDPGSGSGGVGGNPTDENLGLGGDAKGSQVRVSFRVSNLENITAAIAVKAEGLDASFPVFSNAIVNEVSKRDSETRRVLLNGRRLRVVAVPGTQKIYNVDEYPCPSNALPGLTCHSASATYDVLMSGEEDQAGVQNEYTDATQTAVNAGTYNNILQRVDPKTPLFIGIMTNKDQIPPGSRVRGFDGEEEDDDWFKWWYILILLLLLLLCCFICLYCWMLLARRNPPPKESVYEHREVMVEEFDDEGTDHGAPDDEEDFVDDDGAGVNVPYGQAPSPAPVPVAGGSMVAYDPDQQKKNDDQAQRDAILSGSQRGEQWEEDNR